MKALSTVLASALVVLAPTESARGGAGGTPTLEIVTFRLVAGTGESDFLDAARGTEAVLRETNAVAGRWLTRDDAGLWTDVVLWTSREAALSAAADAMVEPAFGAFMALIDPETIAMRHAGILWQME